MTGLFRCTHSGSLCHFGQEGGKGEREWREGEVREGGKIYIIFKVVSSMFLQMFLQTKQQRIVFILKHLSSLTIKPGAITFEMVSLLIYAGSVNNVSFEKCR